MTQSSIWVGDRFVAPADPAVARTRPPDTLPPGESLTCTPGPCTLTRADADHGSTDNTATRK
jgi:hypothetical protein